MIESTNGDSSGSSYFKYYRNREFWMRWNVGRRDRSELKLAGDSISRG